MYYGFIFLAYGACRCVQLIPWKWKCVAENKFCQVYLNAFFLFAVCLSCDEAHLGRLGTGVLQSPNFPFNYRHNETCRYRLYLDHLAVATRTVCFRFQRFDLEASTPFCSFDWLRFGNTKYCAQGLWQYGVPTQSTESNVWFDNFCCKS